MASWVRFGPRGAISRSASRAGRSRHPLVGFHEMGRTVLDGKRIGVPTVICTSRWTRRPARPNPTATRSSPRSSASWARPGINPSGPSRSTGSTASNEDGTSTNIGRTCPRVPMGEADPDTGGGPAGSGTNGPTELPGRAESSPQNDESRRRGMGARVLVVQSDLDDRDLIGSWLEAEGYDVASCPGPTRPEYTCVGSLTQRCPVVE